MSHPTSSLSSVPREISEAHVGSAYCFRKLSQTCCITSVRQISKNIFSSTNHQKIRTGCSYLWNNPPNVYDFLLLAHDQETIIKEHLNTRRKIGIEFLSGISTTD